MEKAVKNMEWVWVIPLPPSVWEFFPHNPVFFSDNDPKPFFIFNLDITWFITVFLSVATISATERANQWLAANYKLYSKQQYFDSQGMFISLAFSAPVLLNCVAVLINWFLKSGDLLVTVKRKELEERAKESKKTQ